MKQIFCFAFVCAAFFAFSDTSTAQTLAFAKKKCIGTCTAGACAQGYELSTDSCNCNSSCECAGNVVCNKRGGGGSQDPQPTCKESVVSPCQFTSLQTFEPDDHDPITQLSSLWGPRIAEGCSVVL